MEQSTLPINKRIYQDLLTKLLGGVWNPGDKLPTEKELQKEYGISRSPVRQALGRLEAEGCIQRTPGRGTVVVRTRTAPVLRLSGLSHFYNPVIDQVTSHTLSVKTVPADEEIAEHLDIAPETLVLKVSRLRLVGGEPTAYMNNYFRMNWDAQVPDLVADHFSLSQLVRQSTNREEVEVQEDLVATIVPPHVGELLHTPAGTPVLFVTRRGWDNQRKPVEFSRYWTRTDFASYRTFLSQS